MFNSKYSNVLTILLIIVIIAILALIVFLGWDMYRKYYIDKDAQDFMQRYEDMFSNSSVSNGNNNITTNEVVNTIIDPGNDTLGSNQNTSNEGKKKPIYKGYGVLGTIEIPKTAIKYPVLDRVTPKSLETSVAYYYGPGLNEIGNTTISGHNYRNGAFFGRNKRLEKGDIIYITDNTGRKIAYTIYNIYTTSPTDGDYLTRDTGGKREISLTTCTDDSKGRLIIWARES